MTITAVGYHRPATLAEACALGRDFGTEGAFLAGGTELLPDYHRGRERASHLIALDRLEELRRIQPVGQELRIGALATVAQVAASALVRAHCPALAEAAGAIGSPALRNRATIGGNFCRAVPCADTPPAAVALGATLRIIGPEGERRLAAEAFFVGPRQTVLQPGEVLAELVVPAQPAGSGTSYQRFARRGGSALAVAAVAARLVLDGARIADARIVLGAVAPVPLLVAGAGELLAGAEPHAGRFAQAGVLSAEAARPITDLRGAADFRRQLVEVLTRRALAAALERAGGGGA